MLRWVLVHILAGALLWGGLSPMAMVPVAPSHDSHSSAHVAMDSIHHPAAHDPMTHGAGDQGDTTHRGIACLAACALHQGPVLEAPQPLPILGTGLVQTASTPRRLIGLNLDPQDPPPRG